MAQRTYAKVRTWASCEQIICNIFLSLSPLWARSGCELRGEIVVKSAATQRHGPVAAAAAASADVVLFWFRLRFAAIARVGAAKWGFRHETSSDSGRNGKAHAGHQLFFRGEGLAALPGGQILCHHRKQAHRQHHLQDQGSGAKPIYFFHQIFTWPTILYFKSRKSLCWA